MVTSLAAASSKPPVPAATVRKFNFQLAVNDDRSRTLYGGTGNRRIKENLLKFVIIPGPQGEDGWLVFRAEPKVFENGCFLEKIISDAVTSATPPDWVLEFGIKKIPLQWFHNNQQVTNASGYPVRLFYAYYQRLPSKEDQAGMMEVVCEEVMKAYPTDPRDQGTTFQLDRNDMTWLTHDKVVWNDIIGEEAAKRALVREIGPPLQPTYYNRNRAIIECFFRPGSMSEALVRWLKVSPEAAEFLMGPTESLSDPDPEAADDA
jgi:hypothetical protein